MEARPLATDPPSSPGVPDPDPWRDLLARPDPGPAHMSASTRNWPGYFRSVANKPPRDTLLEALDRFDAASGRGGIASPRGTSGVGRPLAIDLGCGEGRDTAELLRRGWRVLALDGHEMGVELTRTRADVRAIIADDPSRADDLHVRTMLLERIDRLPACRLLNASFSLPFCPPDRFQALWSAIVDALTPGGRFAGQLFGDRDSWAKLPDRSHQSRERALGLFSPFTLESFREEERDGDTTEGQHKHWHVFHVVALKR